MTLALVLALLLPPGTPAVRRGPRHPCLVLADQCRAKVRRCDDGGGFGACARARGCINRYESTCGPWWTL